MSEAGAPWIKVKDFTETTLWISATNTTTQLSITGSSKVELTELSEKGMILRLPANSCAFGHLLVIRIRRGKKALGVQPAFQAEEPEISLTAKVTEVEPLDRGSKVVTLQFYQYDEAAWKRFVAEFVAKQESINNLVRRMKE